jgi:hypothetical protein
LSSPSDCTPSPNYYDDCEHTLHFEEVLAVHRSPQLAPHERRHHPIAVRLILLRDLDDRSLDQIVSRPPLRRLPRLRRPVEPLRLIPAARATAASG